MRAIDFARLGRSSAHRQAALLLPYSETTSVSYDDANLPTQVTHGNSSVTVYDHDDLGRTLDVWHKTSGGTTLGRYQYEYDNASNVTKRTDNDGSVTNFGYDGANQLTSETRTPVSPYTITYSYDGNGNRLTKVLNSVTESYSYDFNDKLTSAGGKTYQYDNNGNCTSVTSGGQTTSCQSAFRIEPLCRV